MINDFSQAALLHAHSSLCPVLKLSANFSATYKIRFHELVEYGHPQESFLKSLNPGVKTRCTKSRAAKLFKFSLDIQGL